jgi:hypothetical protein
LFVRPRAWRPLGVGVLFVSGCSISAEDSLLQLTVDGWYFLFVDKVLCKQDWWVNERHISRPEIQEAAKVSVGLMV